MNINRAGLDQTGMRPQELDAEAGRTIEVEELIPEALGYMEGCHEVVAGGTVDEKRRLLRAFTRRIGLDPDTGPSGALLPANRNGFADRCRRRRQFVSNNGSGGALGR